MKIKNTIKLAFKDLRRSRRNFILSAVGISIGIFVLVLIVSFSEGFKKSITEVFHSIADLREVFVSAPFEEIEEEIIQKEIKKEDIEKIKKFPEVEVVWHKYKFNAKYSLGEESIDSKLNSLPQKAFGMKKKINLVCGREYKNEKEIVIEEEILKKMGIEKPEEALNKKIIIEPFILDWEKIPEDESGKLFKEMKLPEEAKEYFSGKVNFKIVGVMKTPPMPDGYSTTGDNNLIDILPAEKIYQKYAEKKPEYDNSNDLSSLLLLVKDQKDVEAVSQKIKNMGYEVYSGKEDIKTMESFFRIINIGAFVFAGTFLFVAIIGIANTMHILILQRKREIGILKAIGAKNKDVLSIFLSEAALIGFFGALIGIFSAMAIGSLISFGIEKLIKGEKLFEIFFTGKAIYPHLPLWLFLGAIFVAIFFCVLATYKPAKQAAKLPPVEALRYE